MALPPEPLDEILPQATYGVVAEIKQILQQEEHPPPPDTNDPQAVDVPRDLPGQRILLIAKTTLFGNAPTGEFEVYKPAGDYVLRGGIEGPFLLQVSEGDQPPKILGRYGPDTYSERALQNAIKAHGLT